MTHASVPAKAAPAGPGPAATAPLPTHPSATDPTGDAPTVTIGVAVAVPEPDAGRLQAARRRFGDPLADRIRTHITILGPRVLPVAALDDVAAHLAAVAARHAPYRVVLAGTGTFRPTTQVVFLAMATGADACAALARDVCRGPLAGDLAYPYHPHVTLAHDVPGGQLDAAQAELADERVEFVADAVTLYVNDADACWRPLRAFPLSAGS